MKNVNKLSAVATRHPIGQAIRSIRIQQGLSEADVAKALGKTLTELQSIESGTQTLVVDELWSVASALDCEVTTLLNRMTQLDSILDRWELSESEFTELVDDNPSLRGMVLGYAAEVKFRRMFLAGRSDIQSWKDDDHDRQKKGDRRLVYKGREIVVEVKSLQTKTASYDQLSGVWTGKSQVDGSDRRVVEFDDGTTLDTTLLLKGEFDILAVNCFAFGGKWRFVFALNKDLKLSTYGKYTEAQRAQLLSSMQDVSWPPKEPFTDDWDDILERAWRERQSAPDAEVIDD